jgi:hypothetical protein
MPELQESFGTKEGRVGAQVRMLGSWRRTRTRS